VSMMSSEIRTGMSPVPAAEAVQFDKYDAATYPDGLYEYRTVAEGIDGFDALTDEHVAFYREHGYLVIHNAFDRTEVTSAIDGLLDLIDGRNPEFRGLQMEASARRLLPTAPRERKQDLVRKLHRYVNFDTRLKAIAEHPRLLHAVGRLLEAQPSLLADQAMLKPPLIGREKPWHQDQAFFNVPVAARVVGAWIALDEATPENGCMHILPGRHRQRIVHFQRRDWQICDEHVATDEVLAVPPRPGGLLFFDSFLPHGTPATHSSRRRRALQLHYCAAGVERTDAKERMAVFGSDGKDVTCA
jgi:phytanoyl-CoA hydroxylase